MRYLGCRVEPTFLSCCFSIQKWSIIGPTSSCSGSGVGLDLLLSLAAGSVAVLLTSVYVSEMSAATSAGGVSSQSLGGPVISSLLSVETTA